jgi:hypothetical protein
MDVFPFKPGDWVQDGCDRIAKIKDVWEDRGQVLLDLVMFDHSGDKLGRVSPVMGGPRTFEPACSAQGWERIAKPDFPIVMTWRDNGNGTVSPRMWGGDRLPPANWKKRQRKTAVVVRSDDRIRRALQAIADGHNDPRTLALEVLKGL